ncbi:MAG: exosortase/archaeosortase family protein [Proteobacteria bacterium]|nr:exosortase/archaeosortase family protein [Pseudomonadota bacterium]MBU1711083.1 exosortase/archaeosortase family protein [Pseudomonadota bacterium]
MRNNNSLFTSEKTEPFPGTIRFLVFLLLLVGLGITLYREALSALSFAVLDRQDSSHGIFVPVISAYFLWLKSSKIKGIQPETALFSGAAMLIAGVLFFILGNIWGFQLSNLSFLFIVGALILILFGKEMFVETSLPLFFLATMIPLPTGMYYQIADWMRSINTWGSVAVTKAFGVPVYREGYDVFIPGLHLVVNHGCSGIRYLLSFFTFSIVYAALFKTGNLSRVLLVLGSIPLSIAAGIARLSVVFLAAHYISPYWAEHTPHVVLSWVVFVVFLFGTFTLDQYLIRRRAKC